MPIALIEAQLAGLPVVATNVGSNSEVIEHGVTGFVTEKDVDSIVTALKFLIASNHLPESMSEAAENSSSKKFNLETMLAHHQRIYNKLLEGGIEKKLTRNC